MKVIKLAFDLVQCTALLILAGCGATLSVITLSNQSLPPVFDLICLILVTLIMSFAVISYGVACLFCIREYRREIEAAY